MSNNNDQRPVTAQEQFLKSSPIGQQLLNLRKSWGWFIGFGILITVCGLLAALFLFASTLASMFLLGTFMFVGGVFQMIAAFQARQIKPLFWGLMISGILFVLACFIAFARPIEAAIAITLLVALFLAASGILRAIAGFQAKGMDGRGWVIASGVIGILAGVLIAMNLPQMAVFLPGMFLACDLLFQGISMLMVGWTLKKGLSR